LNFSLWQTTQYWFRRARSLVAVWAADAEAAAGVCDQTNGQQINDRTTKDPVVGILLFMGLADFKSIRRPAISVWPNCAKFFTILAGDKNCIKVTPSQQVGKNFRVPADTSEKDLPGVCPNTRISVQIGCLQPRIMPVWSR
jgi:hypothetical protein